MITIYGYSDDLVEIEGCAGADEFNTDNFEADLVAPDDTQMTVYCRYERSGCWSVGVGLADEDHPLPEWPLRIRQGTDKHRRIHDHATRNLRRRHRRSAAPHHPDTRA